jgi:hypothetical protein
MVYSDLKLDNLLKMRLFCEKNIKSPFNNIKFFPEILCNFEIEHLAPIE